MPARRAVRGMMFQLSPSDTAVLSVTKIVGGDAYNVIPQTATMSGTCRAFKREVMNQMEEGMKRIAKGVAEGFGATAEVDFRFIFAPLIMASEDFAFMLNEIPGCYVNIGNGEGEGACEVHNPAYDFNDAALPYGASFFARLVEKRLART